MRKKLLCLVSVIISVAGVTSVYLASLDNPTEIQKQLSTTANMITVAGTTAIFSLLDDDDQGDSTAT